MNRLSLLRSHWDRALAAGLLLVGLVVLIIGWHDVSRVPFASQQIPYVISAGLGGVFLLGVASTIWLSADLMDEWRKLHLLEQAVRALPVADSQPPAVDQEEIVRAVVQRLLETNEKPARRSTRRPSK